MLIHFLYLKKTIKVFFIHKLFNYIYDYSSRLYLATHTFLYFTCLIIHITIISSYVYLLLLVLFCFTWFKKIIEKLIKLLKSTFEFTICLLNSTIANQN